MNVRTDAHRLLISLMSLHSQIKSHMVVLDFERAFYKTKISNIEMK